MPAISGASDAGVRVLCLLKNFGAGGAERLVLEMAPHMKDVEMTVTALHKGTGELHPAFSDAGLAPRVLARSPLDPRWLARLRRVINDEQPNILHVHLPLPGVGARMASIGLGIPVVYTEHSAWGSHHWLTRLANSLTFSLNDVVVTVSEATRRSIVRSHLGRLSANRIVTIENGIDPDLVRRDAAVVVPDMPSPSYGSLISRLRPQKGPDVLVRAVGLLRNEFEHHRCVIVGGGEFLRPLRRLAEELGVSSSIDFLGRRMDARAIMANMDVVVVPSRFEGSPLVPLEALSLGRPIVATDVYGNSRLIHDGVNGLLVPPDDPVRLAEAIARLLRDQTLRDRLGRAGQRTMREHWNITETAENYVALYHRVLRDRGIQ